MTRDEALQRAGEAFDKLYGDNTRKLITDLILAERPDDEIADLLALACAQRDGARETFLAEVVAGLDEHFPPSVTH